MIDLRQSRKGYRERCRWWTRTEDDEDTPDELIMKRIPSGEFMAREENPESLRNNIVGGVFLIDNTHVTIKSPDNLEAIKSEDIVEYMGQKWRVTSVQRTKSQVRNTDFGSINNYQHYWYVELRK